MKHPQRIVSLWEMIEIKHADELIVGVAVLTHLNADLIKALRDTAGPDMTLNLRLPAGSVSQLVEGAKMIESIAIRTDMHVCKLAAQELRQACAGFELSEDESVLLQRDRVKLISESLSYLIKTFRAEFQSRFVFIMNSAHIAFYSPAEPLFGEAVEAAFHSSSEEIAEAGRCRATARWTGCVIHLMRALEPALMALQVAVDVEVPKDQWDQILNQIECRIRKITKPNWSKLDEQWYSEVASHFRFIKNAWRNYAAHGKERYDEERAVEIWNSTRALMRQLSTRLVEF